MAELSPHGSPPPSAHCLPATLCTTGGFRKSSPGTDGSPVLPHTPFYTMEAMGRNTANSGKILNRLEPPALSSLQRPPQAPQQPMAPQRCWEARREPGGGLSRRLGSTHQYVDILLLIQQRPHFLYIAVEDGLDQRRLQREGWEGGEGGRRSPESRARSVRGAGRGAEQLDPHQGPTSKPAEAVLMAWYLLATGIDAFV